jgi:hypothetical protein
MDVVAGGTRRCRRGTAHGPVIFGTLPRRPRNHHSGAGHSVPGGPRIESVGAVNERTVELNDRSGVELDEPRVQIPLDASLRHMDPAPTRLSDLWKRRKGTILWSIVAALAVVLVIVVGARVLSGATTPPRHFGFDFEAPACGCAKVTQTTFAFPTQSTVDFHWWVSWVGNNATAQLTIATSGNTTVFMAIAEYQQGNPLDPNATWAQGGSGTFSGKGSPFTFGVEVISLVNFLPADTTIWVNGTYTSPLL